ncbi:MAG: DUF2283 domain-containing protein [Gemmatimonadales bacterium]
MRFTYSPTADALAVELAPEAKTASSRTLGEGIQADFDAGGRLITLEILNASQHYPAPALEALGSPPEYLTLTAAAKECGLAPATLRKQVHNGRIPATKQGRDWLIARHDLLAYLESRDPRGRPARQSPANV